jgi:hypothetical protein
MLIKTTTGISTFHKPMSKPIVQADKAESHHFVETKPKIKTQF